MCYSHLSLPLLLLLLLLGCSMEEDLFPSSSDERPKILSGTLGAQPNQVAADFTLSDTLGSPFTLSSQLAGGDSPVDEVVLYFTMGCPICLSHSDHLLQQIEPQFRERGKVRYLLVDYLSGTVAASRASELANGYGDSILTTLVDSQQQLLQQFDATMGTVVVIDASGTIRLNEDYRDGRRVTEVLDLLLPE